MDSLCGKLDVRDAINLVALIDRGRIFRTGQGRGKIKGNNRASKMLGL